jgi:O-antigen ligase
MATMSIGVGIVALALLVSCGGPRGLARAALLEWRSGSQEFRTFGWASIVFFLAGVVSLVAAMVFPTIIRGEPYAVHPLKDAAKSWYFGWPFLLALGLRRLSGPQRSGILRAWLLTFAGVSVVGVGQFFTGWPRPQAIPTFPGRFHSTLFLGHHLSVVSLWIFPFFVALEAAFATNRAGERALPRVLPRWVLLVAAGLGALVLLLAFSRMGWVALAGSLVVWSFLRFEQGKARVALLAGTLAIGAGLWQWEPIQTRLKNMMGVSERERLWGEAWQFFLERPLTGVGWQNTQDAVRALRQGQGQGFIGHAHSMPLELLSSMGALGLLAYLGWWFCLGRVFRKVSDEPGLARVGLSFRVFLAVFVAFFVNGLTQVNFWDGKVLHQVMWFAALGLALGHPGVGPARGSVGSVPPVQGDGRAGA